jgi:hypothetical protein
MPTIAELIRSSSLVFTGTVVKLNASTVSALPAQSNFAVVRADRGLYVDPVLGDVKGQMITVATREDLRVGEKAVFFTLSWVHGGGIAVREVAHLEPGAEKEVVATVEKLPDLRLEDRLLDAEIVVLATVTAVRPIPRQTGGKDYPEWKRAVLRVQSTLKGAADVADFLFPTGSSREWVSSPRFKSRQRGIFLLHRNNPRATAWLGKELQASSLTALDPVDFQPASTLAKVRSLLAAINSKGGVR